MLGSDLTVNAAHSQSSSRASSSVEAAPPSLLSRLRPPTIARGKNDAQLKWTRHARECIKPAIKYFEEHLKADLMDIPLKAFKAARYFSPHNVKKIKPESADLSSC